MDRKKEIQVNNASEQLKFLKLELSKTTKELGQKLQLLSSVNEEIQKVQNYIDESYDKLLESKHNLREVEEDVREKKGEIDIKLALADKKLAEANFEANKTISEARQECAELQRTRDLLRKDEIEIEHYLEERRMQIVDLDKILEETANAIYLQKANYKKEQEEYEERGKGQKEVLNDLDACINDRREELRNIVVAIALEKEKISKPMQLLDEREKYLNNIFKDLQVLEKRVRKYYQTANLPWVDQIN